MNQPDLLRTARSTLGMALDLGDRDAQEDAAGMVGADDARFAAHAGILGVVCDGMGGMLHGAQASRVALAAFKTAYAEKVDTESIPVALRRAAQAANRAVFDAAAAASAAGRMGCTLAAFVVRGIEFYWIYAGDSRIYHLSAGRLIQVSSDHNYGAALDVQVMRGEIAPLSAANHPDREKLTSHLGREDIPLLDGAARPIRLQSGDWIMACSDGVYSVLSDAQIKSALIGAPNAAAIALMDAVRRSDHPDKDNASVVVAHVSAGRVTVSQHTGQESEGSRLSHRAHDADLPAALSTRRSPKGPRSDVPWRIVAPMVFGVGVIGVLVGLALQSSPSEVPEPAPKVDTKTVISVQPEAPVTQGRYVGVTSGAGAVDVGAPLMETSPAATVAATPSKAAGAGAGSQKTPAATSTTPPPNGAGVSNKAEGLNTRQGNAHQTGPQNGSTSGAPPAQTTVTTTTPTPVDAREGGVEGTTSTNTAQSTTPAAQAAATASPTTSSPGSPTTQIGKSHESKPLHAAAVPVATPETVVKTGGDPSPNVGH